MSLLLIYQHVIQTKKAFSMLHHVDDNEEEKILVREFEQTALGRIVMAYKNGEMLDAYISDITYAIYPSNSPMEHSVGFDTGQALGSL